MCALVFLFRLLNIITWYICFLVGIRFFNRWARCQHRHKEIVLLFTELHKKYFFFCPFALLYVTINYLFRITTLMWFFSSSRAILKLNLVEKYASVSKLCNVPDTYSLDCFLWPAHCKGSVKNNLKTKPFVQIYYYLALVQDMFNATVLAEVHQGLYLVCMCHE